MKLLPFGVFCRLKAKRLIVGLRAVMGTCKQRFIKCDFKGLDGVICFQSKHCVSVSLLIGPGWPYTWPEKQSKHPVDFRLFFSHLFNSRLASVSILWQHYCSDGQSTTNQLAFSPFTACFTDLSLSGQRFIENFTGIYTAHNCTQAVLINRSHVVPKFK